ncbi:MAG TPA: DUF2652 domain-containing protein [Kofleriaceae bacterium]|nr:DUF2652 domain-containing protein [Kofleriaceae bacterium]
MAFRALLVIADIGGYTRFMRVHRINLAHAQYIVGRLLEATIDAAGARWKLAKLEGDAAFFYARLPQGAGLDGGRLRDQLIAIRRAFHRRREQLVADRMCSCDACMQSGNLTLKFVAHAGEVALQKVKRLTELAGVDVILVHRLLKNTVPVAEYVLMSEEVTAALGEAGLAADPAEVEEDLEGLGRVRTFYFELDQLERLEAERPARASIPVRVWHWLRMTARSLPYFIGARQACRGFGHLGDITGAPGAPSLPPAAAPE